MTDLDVLLKAIVDAPDDDLPRLAFADCLEERGEAARANFVRESIADRCPLSVEQAREWFWPFGKEPLRVRYKARPRTWEITWRQYFRPAAPTLFVCRGLVDGAAMTLDDWMWRAGSKLIVAHPLRRLILIDKVPEEKPAPVGVECWGWNARGPDSRHKLPNKIVSMLKGGTGPQGTIFGSRVLAEQALATACATWARFVAAKRSHAAT